MMMVLKLTMFLKIYITQNGCAVHYESTWHNNIALSDVIIRYDCINVVKLIKNMNYSYALWYKNSTICNGMLANGTLYF